MLSRCKNLAPVTLGAILVALAACSSPSPSLLNQTSGSEAAATPTAVEVLGPESRQEAGGGIPSRGGVDSPSESSAPPISAQAAPEVPTSPSAAPAPPATAVPKSGAAPSPEPTEAPLQPVTVYQNYVVRPGDTLTDISIRTGVSIASLMRLNGLQSADWLQAGQVLHISKTVQAGRAPGDKLIPDSELVYSPAYENLDLPAIVNQYGGYLARYREDVEGMKGLTGPQIIQLVAERFSVGPRVLLALLELESGWVTGSPGTSNALTYPMGYYNASWSGLYKQVWFAADKLNEGYYGQYYKTMDSLTLLDGARLALSARANPGTVALQDFFAYQSNYATWKSQLSPAGFSAAYQKLFGDPFAHVIDPLVPAELKQPAFRLPWQDGITWFFTGGPHGGWADGSAWAAVDFAPTNGGGTCIPSTEWAVAVAPGRIVQSENGRVMENLDGKSFPGAGWTVMYMHMASAGRVAVGQMVNPGDGVGHPSCEGGYSQADHLHIARLYNGQWIAAADRRIPLILGGWLISGATDQYDGSISSGRVSMDACNCRELDLNGITAGGPQVNAENDSGSLSAVGDSGSGSQGTEDNTGGTDPSPGN